MTAQTENIGIHVRESHMPTLDPVRDAARILAAQLTIAEAFMGDRDEIRRLLDMLGIGWLSEQPA